VLDENFGTEDYGVGTRKDDTELMAKLQKTLDEMKKPTVRPRRFRPSGSARTSSRK
jgi:ABC-type amino acid transport substrate-binding protein